MEFSSLDMSRVSPDPQTAGSPGMSPTLPKTDRLLLISPFHQISQRMKSDWPQRSETASCGHRMADEAGKPRTLDLASAKGWRFCGSTATLSSRERKTVSSAHRMLGAHGAPCRTQTELHSVH